MIIRVDLLIRYFRYLSVIKTWAQVWDMATTNKPFKAMGVSLSRVQSINVQ
jgi:hypothetical protein